MAATAGSPSRILSLTEQNQYPTTTTTTHPSVGRNSYSLFPRRARTATLLYYSLASHPWHQTSGTTQAFASLIHRCFFSAFLLCLLINRPLFPCIFYTPLLYAFYFFFFFLFPFAYLCSLHLQLFRSNPPQNKSYCSFIRCPLLRFVFHTFSPFGKFAFVSCFILYAWRFLSSVTLKAAFPNPE